MNAAKAGFPERTMVRNTILLGCAPVAVPSGHCLVCTRPGSAEPRLPSNRTGQHHQAVEHGGPDKIPGVWTGNQD
jgi:hypothetical protein